MSPQVSNDQVVPFDYSRFYALNEGFEHGAFRVSAVDEISNPWAITRTEMVPDKPIRFVRDEGARLLDLVGTTEAVLILVSDRVISALRDASFIGWTTYAVDIREWNNEQLTGYHGLAVTGRSGPIEDSLSPIEVLLPYAPGGEAMPHYIGLRFRPETWDGSDIFSPVGSAWVLMTEPVRDVLISIGATNMTIEPITEVHRFVPDDEERSAP